MAKGTVNKVILIGRLGADPELRYTPSGAAVCNFNMATNEMWKDEGGNLQERTEWHRIVVWRELGERCAEWLKKGSHVYIEGRLQTRSWEDQNGIKRKSTEIVAQRMQMLDKRGEEPEGPLTPEEPPTDEGPQVSGGDGLPF
ncbi:MAG: single-stranded DNA-binding protein [bacterium]